jgi:hypothetical protein
VAESPMTYVTDALAGRLLTAVQCFRLRTLMCADATRLHVRFTLTSRESARHPTVRESIPSRDRSGGPWRNACRRGSSHHTGSRAVTIWRVSAKRARARVPRGALM